MSRTTSFWRCSSPTSPVLKAVPRGPAVSGERQSLAPWRRHRGRQRQMPRDAGRGGGWCLGIQCFIVVFFGGGNQDLSGPCHPNWKCSWIVSHAFECSPCPHHYHYHYGWFSGTFHAKSMGELCPMILWLMWVGNLQKHGDWCKQERVYTHRLPGVAIHHYLGEAPNYIMNQGFIN